MAEKSGSIYARVTPEVKEQAEAVFNALGLSMSGAIEVFLRQVVMRRGLPFDVKVIKKPLRLQDLSDEELNRELQKGYDDVLAGRVYTEDEMEARFRASGRA